MGGVPEAIGYRISKIIWFKKTGDKNWSIYQQWYVDTNLNRLIDSDFRFEKFAGYDDETVYEVKALGIGNNPGGNSLRISLGMLRNNQSGWVSGRP